MKRFVQTVCAVGAVALFVAPASAAQSTTSGNAANGAATTKAMMLQCSSMMQEVMADPVVRARMMAIMQKHMQRGAQGSMMMPGMSGGMGMHNGALASPPAHDAHHSASPMMAPTSATVPLPKPSP